MISASRRSGPPTSLGSALLESPKRPSRHQAPGGDATSALALLESPKRPSRRWFHRVTEMTVVAPSFRSLRRRPASLQPPKRPSRYVGSAPAAETTFMSPGHHRCASAPLSSGRRNDLCSARCPRCDVRFALRPLPKQHSFHDASAACSVRSVSLQSPKRPSFHDAFTTAVRLPCPSGRRNDLRSTARSPRAASTPFLSGRRNDLCSTELPLRCSVHSGSLQLPKQPSFLGAFTTCCV